MGTRHLTCVYKNGEYKVAQYGQWDGYPRGAGVEILTFLKSHKLSEISQSINSVGWITQKENSSQWEYCGADANSDFVNMEISELYDKIFPENSRNTGSKILELAYDFFLKNKENKKSKCSYCGQWGDVYSECSRCGSPIDNDNLLKIVNSLDFAKDSLFCEYVYVVDFDKNTFEIYFGFNEEKLDRSERFYFNGTPNEDGYYPVKLSKVYSLKNLPSISDFINDFE